MKFSFIKYALFFLCIKKIISAKKSLKDVFFGKLILNKNNTFYNDYNISIHSILNYPYLLKYNFTINFKIQNISIINGNDIHISLFNNNKNLDIYFIDKEDSIINLILNKSIDSMLSFNYLIFTSNNVSKTIGESLSYQLFYIDKNDYASINNFIKIYLNDKENISINILYDNTYSLIPFSFINYSIKIPLYSILLLILINKILFNKNRYFNLCFNSSILRIIFSIIYILTTKEKLKYNKNKFRYLSGLSVDSYIDSMNNLINDIYLSFIFTSMLFIINNEISIIQFFNVSDGKIKIYFGVFLFLSLINIPNYLFNQSLDIALIDIIFLKLKKIIYEILKIFLFLYFIKKQIKIISQVMFYYSLYRITNNFKCLIIKKMFYKNIRFIFLCFNLYNFYLREICFRKYMNNSYYWDLIDKCSLENFNSCIIFMFWILLNISEENNALLLLLSKKRNNENKNYNIYRFEIKNEITNNNYLIIKPNLNITIYKKYPLIVLNPFVEQFNNKNFEKISIGIIE